MDVRQPRFPPGVTAFVETLTVMTFLILIAAGAQGRQITLSDNSEGAYRVVCGATVLWIARTFPESSAWKCFCLSLLSASVDTLAV